MEFYDFPYIGNFIIPTDFRIFQRGRSTTNQIVLAGDLQMYHDVPLVADSFVVWDPPTGPSNWGYVWQFFGVSRNYGTMVIKAISWDMGSLTTVFFFFISENPLVHWKCTCQGLGHSGEDEWGQHESKVVKWLTSHE